MKKSAFLKLAYLGLILCLLVTLFCSGCSKSTTIPGTTAKSASIQSGGILKFGIASNPISLGMLGDNSISSRCAIESLGRYDKSGNLLPWLADNWQIDSQAATITIVLKKGIKFHDGSDFNATVCKWNLDTYNSAATGKTELQSVKSVDIVNDNTVRVTLKSWDNTILGGLLYKAGTMISEKAYETNGKDWCMRNPIGTGPFQFVSWTNNVKIVFKKFDGYWQKGKPYLDGVEINIFADALTEEAALKAGDLDEAIGIIATDLPALRTAGFNVVQLASGIGGTEIGIIGDSGHDDSPFANLKVRQAIGYALDAKALADLLGVCILTNQWGTPSSWAYNKDVQGFTYDPAKAIQLLKDSGYPQGFTTTLYCGNDTNNKNYGTAVQSYLAKIGITVNVQLCDMSKYNDYVTKGWSGLIMTRPQVEAIPFNKWSNVFQTGGFQYVSIIHPREIDDLIAQGRLATDQKTMQPIAFQIQKALLDTYALYVPSYVQTPGVVKSKFVQDDGVMLTDGTQWLPETAWLQK
jgi:ABC-type transport system substrate-binding protein